MAKAGKRTKVLRRKLAAKVIRMTTRRVESSSVPRALASYLTNAKFEVIFLT